MGGIDDNVGVTGYLVERCQGAGCTTFAQIATSSGTSFNDTGLASSTSYSYRVRATDAAGNLSTYSNTATATTQAGPDTQPPTAPSGLTATALSSSQIALAWTASTDNVGVTGYRIERCQDSGCSAFAQIATPTTTTYTDTGLLASTTYSTGSAPPIRQQPECLLEYRQREHAGARRRESPRVCNRNTFRHRWSGTAFNRTTLTLNVSGTNTMILAAWHAEYDGNNPDSWTVTCNGVPGTLITDTNGYNGGDGNRRFRTYYWLNPSPGTNTIVVSNPYNGGNELAVSAILLNNVSQVSPIGTPALDVSTVARTSE